VKSLNLVFDLINESGLEVLLGQRFELRRGRQRFKGLKALVLSGGGVKGAFQLGVLRALLEQNPELDYDIYCGISVGALNASMLASGPLKETLPELERIWFEEIKGNRSVWTHHLLYYILSGIIVIALFIIAGFLSFILDGPKWLTVSCGALALLSLYLPYFSLKKTKSIYKSEPLRDLIEEYLDLEKLRSNNKKLKVGAVSYNSGEYRSVGKEEPELISWIMASSAFPIFFPMEEIEGEFWTDGGVSDVVPLFDAINMGATEIDVILASPLKIGKENGLGLPRQILRILDILSGETIKNDLLICEGNPNTHIYLPSIPIDVNSLNFDPERIRQLYEMGQKESSHYYGS
jgi:NTE family protein